MRVRLDALNRIEYRSIAVQQVPDDAEGDVGVVAEPGVREKDVGEGGDEERESESRILIGCGRGLSFDSGGMAVGNHGGRARKERRAAPPSACDVLLEAVRAWPR